MEWKDKPTVEGKYKVRDVITKIENTSFKVVVDVLGYGLGVVTDLSVVPISNCIQTEWFGPIDENGECETTDKELASKIKTKIFEFNELVKEAAARDMVVDLTYDRTIVVGDECKSFLFEVKVVKTITELL